MHILEIENDNLMIKIDNNVINASIDIFSNIDDITKGMIECLLELNNITLETAFYILSMWCGGIPNHKIKYLNSSKSDYYELNDYNFSQIENKELLNNKITDIKKSIKNKKIKTITTYECNSNIEIVSACIYHFIKNGHSIRKCSHCGKYFITTKRILEKYCLRTNESGKTCRDIANNKNRMESQKKEPQLTEHRVRTNLLKNASQEVYNEFMKEKAIWKEKYKKELITLDEYITWLKSNNKRKKN